MVKYCVFCGRQTYAVHHLVFGNGRRELADRDKLYIPICDYHHTMSNRIHERIHDNSMAEKLSKMLGQQMYEKNKILEGFTQEEARKSFIERYGKSYLWE